LIEQRATSANRVGETLSPSLTQSSCGYDCFTLCQKRGATREFEAAAGFHAHAIPVDRALRKLGVNCAHLLQGSFVSIEWTDNLFHE
jgi:hypothetical protein